VAYKRSDKKIIIPLDPPCKKTIYNSFEDAQDMILYIKENRGISELYAYKCPVCGFWHLTSKIK